MNRNYEQTVTLPVLVSTNNLKDADGWVHFFPDDRRDSWAVKIVTGSDVTKWTSSATKSEYSLYRGAGGLRYALENKDEFSLTEAHKRLDPHFPDLAPPEDYVKKIGNISLEIKDHKWAVTRANYSWLISEMTEDARLVMWFSEKHGQFLPALYCPDSKTAAFAMLIASRVKVCPQCGEIFVPPAGNVDYCQPRHRDAHRMARKRWRDAQDL